MPLVAGVSAMFVDARALEPGLSEDGDMALNNL